MNREDLAENKFESLQSGRTLDQIGKDIVDAAYQVHKHMGPGLSEAIYQECMERELHSQNIPYTRQELITIKYKGEDLETRYVADIVVEGRVIVELKSVAEILSLHEAQLLNYLKLTNTQLGFLINFNVELIKQGIRGERTVSINKCSSSVVDLTTKDTKCAKPGAIQSLIEFFTLVSLVVN